ncbi:hypothetical protein BDP27DRAFT_1430729 [Rhodocollybia butyracea]|uniref:Uncharacterized protein n=1 Tax=Rhodocollybia butyracea TaxID=206335 RepID=A0A9P5TYK1_9AGAR|nr:hypothetical protein BDP27DRAFT_1430729 [Rhodocollybia butyracea]
MPRTTKTRKDKIFREKDDFSSWLHRTEIAFRYEVDDRLVSAGPILQAHSSQKENPIDISDEAITPRLQRKILDPAAKPCKAPVLPTGNSFPPLPQETDNEILQEVREIRVLLKTFLSNQEDLASRVRSSDSSSHPTSHPTGLSPLETYSITIGGNRVLTYTLDDLPEPPHTKHYLNQVAYMQRLWANWDDKDEHWDGTIHPGDYIIKGTKIAITYWPSVIQPWGNAIKTQWWFYKTLVDESRKFPSIVKFLQAYPDLNGRPQKLTQISKTVNQREKSTGAGLRQSYRKKKVVSSSNEGFPSSMTPRCSGTFVPYSSQPASPFTRYSGVLVRNFNFEGVDISNQAEVLSVARVFIREAGCFPVEREFQASSYGRESLFLMWKHRRDAEAFVNAFSNLPTSYQNLEITPYFQ